MLYCLHCIIKCNVRFDFKTKKGFNMKDVNIKENLTKVNGGFLTCPSKTQAPTQRYEIRCSTEYVWNTPRTVCYQVAVPWYT